MKKKFYMVVDTETATLPFANELANGDSEKKKRIAIARPLVYDIGWTICDREGHIYSSQQFLVAETFSVPTIFNTAYYAEKRPIYLEMLKRGETSVLPWAAIMEIFTEDLKKVNAVGAFNSMFDFKKAIPFTELYISKLYSADYYTWENNQKRICANIANEKPSRKKENNFESNIFRFRNNTYPLFDLWGLATEYLLNNITYKSQCIKHDLFTASGIFFKTSAESTYQYLCKKYDFVESHTALDDAIIETYILSRIAKKHAIREGIDFFPFRKLGTTDEFCMRRKIPNMSECNKVYTAIENYIDAQEECSNYIMGLINRLTALSEYMKGEE